MLLKSILEGRSARYNFVSLISHSEFQLVITDYKCYVCLCFYLKFILMIEEFSNPAVKSGFVAKHERQLPAP